MRLKVGDFYTVLDSLVYECIHIEGEWAWMKCLHDGIPSPALVWKVNGRAVSLPKDYDVRWS
jgi:hypothetical protein